MWRSTEAISAVLVRISDRWGATHENGFTNAANRRGEWIIRR